ncbi:MAG: hypothetical protein ABI461_16710 [Polyangiaceae bacterium]
MTQESTRDSSRSSRKEEGSASASSESERKNEAESRDKDDEKKERVLHTRVPAVLEQELKRFAENLRVPVSNLVRTILEDALEVADVATENVEGRLKKAAGALEKERQKLRKKVLFDPLKDVFAFQSVTLAQGASCAKCRREMPAGTHAHMGLVDPQPTKSRAARIFVCDTCLPKG